MLFRAAHNVRLLYFRFFPKVLQGVRVIALTPQNEVVLVRHTYATPDWMLPGGGVDADGAEASALRELREEIGLISHGPVTHVGEYTGQLGRTTDRINVYLVREVIYQPRPARFMWLREIAAVQAFPLHALPPDMTPSSRRRLEELQGACEKSSVW